MKGEDHANVNHYDISWQKYMLHAELIDNWQAVSTQEAKKKIFKKTNIKNYIILGYKFEHAKVISKSAVYAREQKKNQLRKKIYIIWLHAAFIMKILTSVWR